MHTQIDIKKKKNVPFFNRLKNGCYELLFCETLFVMSCGKECAWLIVKNKEKIS